MFHHFLGGKSGFKAQGAISAGDFKQIIQFVGLENILDPCDFKERYMNSTLEENHLCITFDDALLSQYEVALEVLEDLKIKAFFFIYTDIFDDGFNLFEITRYFRSF